MIDRGRELKLWADTGILLPKSRDLLLRSGWIRIDRYGSPQVTTAGEEALRMANSK